MRRQLVSMLALAAFVSSALLARAQPSRAIQDETNATHTSVSLGTQRELQAAAIDFNAGRVAEAVSRLERLEQLQPRNFEVHESLGLVYAAQGSSAKAIEQLRRGVTLQPRVPTAHDNLATALARSGDLAAAQEEWLTALRLQPGDAGANRNLARLYLQQGDVVAALPLLRAAHAAQPNAADTTYDLALAEMVTGNLRDARTFALQLAALPNAGEAHRLLGTIDEKEAKFVEAANEFATAAHLDPSEENFFSWGSDLLLHRAYPSAIAVFQQGTQRYPASPRLWVGQGMALYSRGEYAPSIQALLTAADLNAADPRCYLFLSKAYLSAPTQAEQVIERFRKYATLEPNNARAQFYYAVSLWKGHRNATDTIDYPAVQALLLRSIALDDTDAEAHLQLGILYNEQHVYDKAEQQYLRATQLDPSLADAHFRLGRAYLRAGDKEKSALELDRFKALQAQHQAQVDRERAEVQQFVIASEVAAPTPAAAQP